VLLVVVIFYPNTKHSITLEDENGKLTIQKKAIEHFVLQIVRKEPFLENPSVKVVMRKKNIKVKIQGKMRKVIAVPQQQRLLIEEVTAELRQLLGTSDKLTTQVVLEDYQETKKNNDSNRVE
jgi:phenylpyruvate tautomerase PptA (4-oxalocrotonate tautomerase family)